MTLIIKITIKLHRQALLIAFAALVGCVRPPSPPGDAGVPDSGLTATRAQVLAAGGTCVVSAAREFQTAAGALETSLKATPSSTATTAARDAFRAAMEKWQINELLQIGPAATSGSLGGGDLRDQIYSWPLVNRCVIDEALVAKSYESLATALINRRGLYAIEYLLFNESTATVCPSTSTIVSSGSWSALSPTELAARRWAYAAAAASLVRLRADELVSRWDTDFLATLKTSGPGNAVFKTQLQGLNAISDALFYIDKQIKDAKLYPPLHNCTTPPCLDQLESPVALLSKSNVKANAEGYRRLYQGCGPNHAGMGFDDLLLAIGANSLATRMSSALDGIDAALAAIEEADLDPALRADLPSVQALYNAFKVLTDLMKTELMSVLDLALPMGLEGDND